MSTIPKRQLSLLLDTRWRHWDQNPFISLLAEGLASDINVLGFSWRRALFARYDIVHVHWPEYLVHRNGRRVVALAQKLLFSLWLLRLHMTRAPIVKTMHNTSPHDHYGKLSNYLLRAFEVRYRSRIWLNRPVGASKEAFSADDILIPHGDYVPWLSSLGVDDEYLKRASSARSANTTSLLCFGIIKRYKSLEEPIKAVVESKNSNLRLVIAGSVSDTGYFTHLQRLSKSDERVNLKAGRLPDAELINEILTCDFVVVPYPNLYNSGVLMLALSLGRPVVLRHSEISESLRDEFGAEWIYLYDGEFSTEVAEELVDHSVDRRALRKLSSKRDWSALAQEHLNLYIRIVRGR